MTGLSQLGHQPKTENTQSINVQAHLRVRRTMIEKPREGSRKAKIKSDYAQPTGQFHRQNNKWCVKDKLNKQHPSTKKLLDIEYVTIQPEHENLINTK